MITTEQYRKLYTKARSRGLKIRSNLNGVIINKRQFLSFEVANEYVIGFPLKVIPHHYEEQIAEFENEDFDDMVN